MRTRPGTGGQQPTTLAICVNRRYGIDRPSCAGRGSIAIADSLEREIADQRLNVAVERVICFGYCSQGPNLRLYPGGARYLEVTPADLPAILADIDRECGRRDDGDDGDAFPVHLLGS